MKTMRRYELLKASPKLQWHKICSTHYEGHTPFPILLGRTYHSVHKKQCLASTVQCQARDGTTQNQFFNSVLRIIIAAVCPAGFLSSACLLDLQMFSLLSSSLLPLATSLQYLLLHDIWLAGRRHLQILERSIFGDRSPLAVDLVLVDVDGNHLRELSVHR